MLTLIVAAILAGQAGDADAGKIVMYRGQSIFGAAISCPNHHEGKEIVELWRGKFAEWRVKPGRYVLSNKILSVETTIQFRQTVSVR